MKLAILITVHNRREKTINCLDSLFRQDLPENCTLDVFLTDDGCTDGTQEAIRDKYPQVHIVQGDGNLYWNRGMHKAWEAAYQYFDYDFYLWLNDDTTLLDGALAEMLAEAEEKPDSVIVGSTRSGFGAGNITYGGRYSGRLIMPNGYLQKCQTFNGNIVIVSKAIFKKIGNLDWIYQHAIGDLDYGWMVTRKGLNNYISKEFRGKCESNPRSPKWILPEVPFKERWRNFHSPLAYGQPGPMFHYNKKNFSLNKAILIWTSNHIRVLFPAIWNKK